MILLFPVLLFGAVPGLPFVFRIGVGGMAPEVLPPLTVADDVVVVVVVVVVIAAVVEVLPISPSFLGGVENGGRVDDEGAVIGVDSFILFKVGGDF